MRFCAFASIVQNSYASLNKLFEFFACYHGLSPPAPLKNIKINAVTQHQAISHFIISYLYSCMKSRFSCKYISRLSRLPGVEFRGGQRLIPNLYSVYSPLRDLRPACLHQSPAWYASLRSGKASCVKVCLKSLRPHRKPQNALCVQ